MEPLRGMSTRTLFSPFRKLSLSLLRNRSGQGLVEFALAIPIFLLVVLGVIEGGRLLYLYSTVTSSAREAARWGAGSDHFTDCSGIVAAAARIGSIAGIDASNVSIGYDSGPGTSVTPGCPPPSDISLGDRIVVDVSMNYTPMVPLVQFDNVPISAQSARTIIHELYLTEEPDEDETEETEPPEEEETKLFLVGLSITKDGDLSKCKDWNTHVTAIVKDETGTFVVGANVTGNWEGVVPAGDGCTTGVGGMCSDLGISITKKGSATFNVNTISKSGYVYDPSMNSAPVTVSESCN